MSWDIVLLNSRQKIQSIEDIDEAQLIPTDFCAVFENHFNNIVRDDNHREIKGEDYSIDYFIDDESVSNKMISLYGENGLFEIVALSRKHGWQIFDTSRREMIDLENPENNGYENFQPYLKHVLKHRE